MASSNEIRKFLAHKLGVRASFAIGTSVVQEMQSIQNTYPIGTLAVGRAMMGAALMASHQKSGQQASLHFRGDGPLEMFFGEASFEGAVRGYTPNPQLELSFPDNKLLLGPAIGNGLLTVTRTKTGEPAQKGNVVLQTGEVGDDLAYFLQQSDQIKSAVTLGVKVNAYGKVEAAGGVLLEVLPGASEDAEQALVKNLEKVGSLSERIATGESCEELKKAYLKGVDATELEHPYKLSYSCKCSKDRLSEALKVFPAKELKEIVQDGRPVTAKCEFCGRSYEMDVQTVEQVLKQLIKESLH